MRNIKCDKNAYNSSLLFLLLPSLVTKYIHNKDLIYCYRTTVLVTRTQ